MSATFSLRNLGLLTALIVTVWLTWQTHDADDSLTPLVRITPAAISSQQTSSLPENAHLNLKPRQRNSHTISDAFSDPVVVQQAAAKPKPVVSEPAIPPELPFQFLGLIQESGKNKVIITQNDEVLILQPGDKIGTDYEFIAATHVGKQNQLSFKYLPMKTTQTMMVENEQ